jgi:predicted XRE-type DNA-binding protein
MRKSKTSDKTSKDEPSYEVGSGNIFVDLGFPEEQAVNMLARANLMGAIRQIIRDTGWTQEQAAKVLKVKQPRVAEIMGMKTQHYSIDLLMKMLNRLGKHVALTVESKSEVA